MIWFTDKTDKTESAEITKSEKYKEIKPSVETTDDKVQSFWSDVFGNKSKTDDTGFKGEDTISEIFHRKESDFKFDFDFKDKSITKVLDKFADEKWDKLSEAKKMKVIDSFADVLCDKLGITERPKVTLFDNSDNYGLYCHGTNSVELNRSILNNPKELVDTIAHETRHAYQYQRASIGKTRMDGLYGTNIVNYIAPVKVNGKYINFIEYQEQLIEAEARAFAKGFKI
ncbi:MAG: hypothetical protein UD936_03355 [Acutalibacteraceae bacterium]|nr:hypothetical protein [Acutalibacteraceae bacterium]